MNWLRNIQNGGESSQLNLSMLQKHSVMYQLPER